MGYEPRFRMTERRSEPGPGVPTQAQAVARALEVLLRPNPEKQDTKEMDRLKAAREEIEQLDQAA